MSKSETNPNQKPLGARAFLTAKARDCSHAGKMPALPGGSFEPASRSTLHALHAPPPDPRILWSVICALLLFSAPAAHAHIGSPDVFYDGMIGPYPARVTIRMPTVVPGRAEIIARVQATQPVQVSFLPLYAHTSTSNAPPPDPGVLVNGETNLYTGELWLMSSGGYSINVQIHGDAGAGSVEIPVTSVATKQLPLPFGLGKLLLALGAILVFGGLAIVSAAARESILPPGAVPGSRERRNGIVAGAVTALIFVLALAGGKKWWSVEEQDFRRHLREGAWPDLTAGVRTEGSQHILLLNFGEQSAPRDAYLSLLPDHGKLLHLFLIREPDRDILAHLHPIRKAGKTFEAALPPIPPGSYRIFCDLTLEDSGMSSTATNSVEIPPIPRDTGAANVLESDPDDSWAVAAVPGAGTVFRLVDGTEFEWKRKPPLHAKEEAGLRFQVRTATGEPADLEPYMGMLCHAAVLRADGAVFAHLHPSGNYSMAAQAFFESKFQREQNGNGTEAAAPPAPMDHAAMGHMHHAHSSSGTSEVYVPYEFPTPGDYRIWVQFKIKGQVLTAVFNATVL
ncbi:MAG: hypothetical protein C5B50_28690 [Verrucomicrobia bacterium]|nr:MAG: hypothetical protein C5B50_28690 [Verrucomicrobiota bacterium]